MGMGRRHDITEHWLTIELLKVHIQEGERFSITVEDGRVRIGSPDKSSRFTVAGLWMDEIRAEPDVSVETGPTT
jgi:hypothetical protein